MSSIAIDLLHQEALTVVNANVVVYHLRLVLLCQIGFPVFTDFIYSHSIGIVNLLQVHTHLIHIFDGIPSESRCVLRSQYSAVIILTFTQSSLDSMRIQTKTFVQLPGHGHQDIHLLHVTYQRVQMTTEQQHLLPSPEIHLSPHRHGMMHRSIEGAQADDTLMIHVHQADLIVEWLWTSTLAKTRRIAKGSVLIGLKINGLEVSRVDSVTKSSKGQRSLFPHLLVPKTTLNMTYNPSTILAHPPDLNRHLVLRNDQSQIGPSSRESRKRNRHLLPVFLLNRNLIIRVCRMWTQCLNKRMHLFLIAMPHLFVSQDPFVFVDLPSKTTPCT